MSKKKTSPKAASKSTEIPKGLFAAATPGLKWGASHASGGNSSSERANDSSPHQTNKVAPPKISAETGQGADMTVARMLGEIVWIMTQSSGHKHFALADLIQGPFKGEKFKFHHTDPMTGQRKVMELGG